MQQVNIRSGWKKGLADGIPIGLGYLSVSFSFGIMAQSQGLPVWAAMLISMTNLTSAGQVAGLGVIAAGGSLLELALTQVVINLRYALMSLSLSQKLDPSVGLGGRLFAAFGNTDEIFAVNMQQPGTLRLPYIAGLMTIPYLGWSLGTLCGAAAGQLLPEMVRSALNIAIYGMFLAIILPPARRMGSVRGVVVLAAAVSCLFAWVPGLDRVSSGFAIILSALFAAGAMAWLSPVEEGEPQGEEERYDS